MQSNYLVSTLVLVVFAEKALCEDSSNLLVDVIRQELNQKEEKLYGPIFELNELYRSNLEKLKMRHQQSGNLEGVLAVNAQIEVIVSGKEIDPGNDRALRQLQKTYFAEKEERGKGLDDEFSALIDEYLASLKRMLAELTREGKVGDAVAVRNEHAFVSEIVEKGKLIPMAAWTDEKRRLSLIPADAAEFEGHTYKVIDENLTWSAARDRCVGLGGHLVSIGIREENRFVASLRGDRYFLWIGLVSDETGKEWHWVNKSEFKYTDWRDERPDNTGGVNSVVMNRWDQWDDASPQSGNVLSFVCEWE